MHLVSFHRKNLPRCVVLWISKKEYVVIVIRIKGIKEEY
jgi:hypothetical protein